MSDGAETCVAASRVAKNPMTGDSLGPSSAIAIGTLVPNTGNRTNGLVEAGHGIAKENYTWPAIGVSRRASAPPTT